MMAAIRNEEDDDDLLLRRLTRCEEDRRRLLPATPWMGGYRWFRGATIIDLQRYRSPAEKERIQVVLLNIRRG